MLTMMALAVAATAATVNPGPGVAYHEVQGNSTTWPWQVYKSSSMTPPNLTITGNGRPLAPGFVFLEPAGFRLGAAPPIRESGGFVMRDNNDLVFAQPVAGMNDFRMQKYNGKPYITYWSGSNTMGLNVGHGYGSVTFLDQGYETAYVLCPDLGLNTGQDPAPACQIDIHEHQMTPRNTMLVSAYNETTADLTAIGGPVNGSILDCLFFELDIPTSKILFQWSALDHVPVTQSKQPYNASIRAPWDYFHVNAVQMVDDLFIVNSRHCWSTYFVSATDGSVLYTIEGSTGGDFGALPANGTFRWQHDARVHNLTKKGTFELSMFDNHNQVLDNGTEPTKGLVLGLQIPPNKAHPPTVLRHLTVASDEIYADSQGSYSPEIGQGHQFMGYGQIAILREYGPDVEGRDLRWQAQFGALNFVQSYRGYKQKWHAVPKGYDPSLVLEAGQGYVSWNGATDVEAWDVYEGASNDSLVFAGQVPFRGFETEFNVPSSGCVQVTALGRPVGGKKNGKCKEIGKSAVVCY